jgi:type IV pilus assembly protein PilV
MVILMVGLLGMLKAINVSIVTNVRNEMRTQAASIAENLLASKKSLPFDNITTTNPKNLSVPIAMRSAVLNYTATYFVDTISSDSRRINIGVRWSYKGNNYEHVVTSIVTRPTTK